MDCTPPVLTYIHSSRAPLTELVTYIDHLGHFPKPFLMLPSPELYLMEKDGDSDRKMLDGQDKVRDAVTAIENKAKAQMRGQNVTPEDKFRAVYE